MTHLFFFYVILIFFQPFSCFFLSKQHTDHTQTFRWESSSVTCPWEIDSPVQVVKNSLLIFRNSYRNFLNFIQNFSNFCSSQENLIPSKTSHQNLFETFRHCRTSCPTKKIPNFFALPELWSLHYHLDTVQYPLSSQSISDLGQSLGFYRRLIVFENSKLISITLLVVKLLVLGVYLVQALLNVF